MKLKSLNPDMHTGILKGAYRLGGAKRGCPSPLLVLGLSLQVLKDEFPLDCFTSSLLVLRDSFVSTPISIARSLSFELLLVLSFKYLLVLLFCLARNLTTLSFFKSLHTPFRR